MNDDTVVLAVRGTNPMNQIKAVSAARFPLQWRADGKPGNDTNPGPANDGATTESADKPALSPELVQRFEALVEEVTQELMQGSPSGDWRTCRADAVALLMAAGERLIDPVDDAESPLKYLLLEEQQRIAVLLDQAPSPRVRGMLKV